MISQDQIKQLAKKYKINDSIVVREYIQLLFLKELYEQSFSKNIFFKGGTAIRLLYKGTRFSEDLDFTVQLDNDPFEKYLQKFFVSFENRHPATFKERKTITGKTFLLTAKVPYLNSDVFVKLDFSMRESVLEPTQNILSTDYPIIMRSFIGSLSRNEILAEKIRAIMSRKKHRDLYDLWALQENGAILDEKLISQKLSYYNEAFDIEKLINRLDDFTKKEFITDLRPFIPINERDDLGNLFEYIKAYLVKGLSGIEK